MMSKIEQKSSQDLAVENKDLKIEGSLHANAKEELSQLKMAKKFSSDVLLTNSVDELVSLTVENFVKTLSQQFCLMYEYDKTHQSLQLLNKTNLKEIPNAIPFKASLVKGKESFVLNNSKLISDALSLSIDEAIVGSLFKSNGDFQGFIICGNVDDFSFDTSLLSLFSIMTNVISLRFDSIKNNELIEAERISINAQLQRSNEDLGHFAYVISHDLKAPLRNIKSFAQLLKKMYRNQLDGDGVTFLDFITGGVSKFDSLIDDLLQYSRVSRRDMPFEKVNLNDIIQEVILSTYITVSKKDVEIKSQKLPTIFGNAHRIEQLFQSLVDNAVKFKQPNVKAKIHIKRKIEKDFVQISITDNGIGIEQQYNDRIFQLFQKLHADSEYKGTGLGLSICKKIVERHKGKIWVESAGLDKGTTFYVLLPKNPSSIS